MSITESQISGWMIYWTNEEGVSMSGTESVYRLYFQSMTDSMKISQLQIMQNAMEKMSDHLTYHEQITLQIISETLLQKRQQYLSELQGMMMQAGV